MQIPSEIVSSDGERADDIDTGSGSGRGTLGTQTSLHDRSLHDGRPPRRLQCRLWPHLEWWRAVPDDGKVERSSDHASLLIEGGYDITDDEADEEKSVVTDFEEQIMNWDEEEGAEAESAAEKA